MDDNRPAPNPSGIPNPSHILPPRLEADIAAANLSGMAAEDLFRYALITVSKSGEAAVSGTCDRTQMIALLSLVLEQL
jgi:hypothetical protein